MVAGLMLSPTVDHFEMSNINDQFVYLGRGKGRVVHCRYCTKRMTSHNIDRWLSHIRQCEACPAPVRASFSIQRQPFDITGPPANASESPSLRSHSLGPGAMQKWVDSMTEDDSVTLETAFASVFFKTGIPFRVADADSVTTFLAKLRPAWKPPS